MPTTYAIPNGATVMAATLYTGTGATQSITNGGNNPTGVTFQPDFVWNKSRSNTYSNWLEDSVRGASKIISSNSTDAEVTDTAFITAFNSNGFSVGNSAGINANAATYVAWQWKAGGAAVSNTDGSITSSVSANTTAGFSIVTYTGNATQGATVGHGLGTTPSMIIVKSRSLATDFVVQHSSAGTAPSKLVLNATNAVTNSAPEWNNAGGTPTAFNSTVFTIAGTGYSVNNSGATYIAYCFAAVAGYSAFGSYTGNGSADGPFVYCGFRPRYILRKRTDSTGGWLAQDSSRPGYNATTTYSSVLYPNTSDAETIYNEIDILSNGFKIRATDTFGNASGGTYIYAAFAENPFKYANAR